MVLLEVGLDKGHTQIQRERERERERETYIEVQHNKRASAQGPGHSGLASSVGVRVEGAGMEREARELRCSKVTVVKYKDTYSSTRTHTSASIYMFQ